MPSHFRSDERQEAGEPTLDAPESSQMPDGTEAQSASAEPEIEAHYPNVSEEEVDAIVNSLRTAPTADDEPVADDVAAEASSQSLSDPLDVVMPLEEGAAAPVAPSAAEPDAGREPIAEDAPGAGLTATNGSPAASLLSIPDPLAEPAPAPEPVEEEREVLAPQARPTRDSIMGPVPEVSRTGTPTISLKNVTLIYPSQPNKPALDDVSLDIYPGEFVFLVGHSGSGKSTFVKLLNRELRATKGEVRVAGQDLTKMRGWKVPYLRRQIGCVFQDFKLLPDKTTYENVAFALECIGKPKSVINAQVPEVLRLVGLGERMDSYPDQLSGGEQQRVSVARAMVNRPPLLICDEPTGNLDPAISLGIMKLLDLINRTGTTVVVATHDREMVDSMRRRVIALESGHLVRDQEKGGYGNYVS